MAAPVSFSRCFGDGPLTKRKEQVTLRHYQFIQPFAELARKFYYTMVEFIRRFVTAYSVSDDFG
jgi:hypothetical protein